MRGGRARPFKIRVRRNSFHGEPGLSIRLATLAPPGTGCRESAMSITMALSAAVQLHTALGEAISLAVAQSSTSKEFNHD
jgi:hypothetical protein